MVLLLFELCFICVFFLMVGSYMISKCLFGGLYGFCCGFTSFVMVIAFKVEVSYGLYRVLSINGLLYLGNVLLANQT